MKNAPDIFYRLYVPFIFATADALFFMMFTMAYSPFDMENVLGMGKGLEVFNILMLSCICYASVALMHLVLCLLRDKISHNWWAYIGWWALELFVVASYMAMYLELIDPNPFGYFKYFALCLKYNFSITVYAHTVLNLVFVILAFVKIIERPVETTGLIKFHDYNKQLKLSVEKSSLLYINAEENYVRIHYLEGKDEKQYVLRRSMRGIEELMNKAGLVRCHRSYFVNPSAVSALRREPGGVITAELAGAAVSIPVSKKNFNELSDRI